MQEKVTIGNKVFSVEVANSFFSRLIGLMFKKSYDPDKALLITPCNSIHMFFMRFPITAVFVNSDGVITDFKKDLKEWRIFFSLFKKSEAVYEISYFGNEDVLPVVGESVFSSNKIC